MANSLSEEKVLSEAFSIIEHTPDTQVVIDKLRDLLKVDHVVYYLPKLGSAPFIRLTYPASWIKRYLQMDYAKIDPISREGAQRTEPFSWNELKISKFGRSLVSGGCSLIWCWACMGSLYPPE